MFRTQHLAVPPHWSKIQPHRPCLWSKVTWPFTYHKRYTICVKLISYCESAPISMQCRCNCLWCPYLQNVWLATVRFSHCLKNVCSFNWIRYLNRHIRRCYTLTMFGGPVRCELIIWLVLTTYAYRPKLTGRVPNWFTCVKEYSRRHLIGSNWRVNQIFITENNIINGK